MKRTDVTYGQLDKVLRSLGFTSRVVNEDPPSRLYEHRESGAYLTVPPFPFSDRVYEYQMVAVRTTLDNFGIADPSTFEADLQRVG
jgi:hypothetical protein